MSSHSSASLLAASLSNYSSTVAPSRLLSSMSDFCIESGESQLSLGQVICGDYDMYTIAFTITFSLLFIAEALLHNIEYIAENSPYQVMVQKIFKEMTALGFITLVTVLLTLSASSNGKSIIPDAIHAPLQQADLVIFIMSIYSVVQASFFMRLSIRQAKRWKRAYNMSIHQILQSFFEDEHRQWWHGFFISEPREQLEFKIMQISFCRSYNIRKSEFNFAAYLNESFEKYLVSQLEDKFHTRIFLGLMIAVNTLRVKAIDTALPSCTSSECIIDRQLRFFVICGWILVVVAIIYMILSRLFELNVIGLSGIYNIDDYRPFVLTEEKIDLEKEKQAQRGDRRESTTLGATEIKDTLKTFEQLMRSQEDRSFIRRQSRVGHIYDNVLSSLGFGSGNQHRSRNHSSNGSFHLDEESDIEDGHTHGPRLTVVDDGRPRVESASLASDGGTASERPVPLPSQLVKIPSALLGKANLMNLSFEALLNMSKMSKVQRSKGTSASKVTSHAHAPVSASDARRKTYAFTAGAALTDQSAGSLRDFEEVFPFHSSKPYFLCIQYLLQLNCIYFALWCTNYVVIPGYSSNEVMWHILMVLPLLIMVPLFVSIITTSSVLNALARLDPDVVGKVLEDAETVGRNASVVKQKILERLRHYRYEDGHDVDHHTLIDKLVKKFGVMSVEDNEYVIHLEHFTLLLSKLQLHFTTKKISSVFSYIDQNLNGNINSAELFRFVYPKQAKRESLDERERSTHRSIHKQRKESDRSRQSSLTSIWKHGARAVGSIFSAGGVPPKYTPSKVAVAENHQSIESTSMGTEAGAPPNGLPAINESNIKAQGRGRSASGRHASFISNDDREDDDDEDDDDDDDDDDSSYSGSGSRRSSSEKITTRSRLLSHISNLDAVQEKEGEFEGDGEDGCSGDRVQESDIDHFTSATCNVTASEPSPFAANNSMDNT